jgi:Na+/melibiose symporter-like transporter
MEKVTMNTDTKQVRSAQEVQMPGAVKRMRHFILHLLEMCLAMCIGWIPLIVLFFWGAARIGYPDLLHRYLELSVLAIGIILSLPMIAWMRFRRMEWRLTLEMSITTIVLGILLAGLGWLGILPRSSLFEWMTALACPSMLIPMFLRLDHYTGGGGHSMLPLTIRGADDPCAAT